MINLNMPNNWTQNQKLIAAGLLSILVSVVSTTATAIVQTYTNSGLDIPVLVNVAVITFFPLLGAALLNYIPAHAIQLMQSLQDAAQQKQNALQGLQQQHNALIAVVQAQSQPVTPVQPVPVAPPPTPVAVAQPVPMAVAQPVVMPQGSSSYIDPLATPITAQMPTVTPTS